MDSLIRVAFNVWERGSAAAAAAISKNNLNFIFIKI
jgi:hypothetical protein